MGIFALVLWRRSKWIWIAIASAGLLSAVRLLPPVLQLADYHKKAIFNAVYGYPSLAHLLYSMSFIQLPTESPIKYFSLNLYSENYWDFNIYIGILGTGFLLYFGVYRCKAAGFDFGHLFFRHLCCWPWRLIQPTGLFD
jgi:hypothetical protein